MGALKEMPLAAASACLFAVDGETPVAVTDLPASEPEGLPVRRRRSRARLSDRYPAERCPSSSELPVDANDADRPALPPAPALTPAMLGTARQATTSSTTTTLRSQRPVNRADAGREKDRS